MLVSGDISNLLPFLNSQVMAAASAGSIESLVFVEAIGRFFKSEAKPRTGRLLLPLRSPGLAVLLPPLLIPCSFAYFGTLMTAKLLI